MAAALAVTPEQLAEERSLIFALVADTAITVAFIAVGLFGGSLTITAEAIRVILMLMIEAFAFAVLRRIHRGTLADLEYGTGKLEQIANVLIGLGLLAGAIWIFSQALAIVDGEAHVGTPFGLALAAIVGAVNLLINLLAWDGMRRAMRADSTLVMAAQLKARIVKLISSLFVIVTMTVAALSTDVVVVAWADVIGSAFVAIFIFVNAIDMLKTGIPDLLDRTAGKEVRASVERALARQAALHGPLYAFRSRRSGRVLFIELALGFEAGLTLAEVGRRIETLKQALRSEIANAEISIFPQPLS